MRFVSYLRPDGQPSFGRLENDRVVDLGESGHATLAMAIAADAVVARSNADLQRVIDLVLTEPGIDRSTTVIALATQIPYRVVPLARAAVQSMNP